MLSPTTGIGCCKTEFHLSGKRIYWCLISAANFVSYIAGKAGLLGASLSQPSATLDRRIKKRFSVYADDEGLRNSFRTFIVGLRIVAFLYAPIKGKPHFVGWLDPCLGFRI